MTIQEFNTLSEFNQEKIIAGSGEMIVDFLQGEKVIQIFRVNEIFVVVRSQKNGVRQLEAIKSPDSLQLYRC